MKFKRLLTFALAATLSFSALTGCGTTNPDSTSAADATKTDSSKTNITLGYLPITHALTVFETKELLDKKSDSDIEVTLQKFSSWTDLMDALNSGKIDGASVLVELAMGAVSNGIDLKAAALGHKDGNVVIVSDDISDVRDLKGKTFAIPSNQSSHNILLNDMLALGDLSIDDINVVQLAPSEMPSSLASGSIDGYCVAEPFGAQAVVQGYGPYYMIPLIYGRILSAVHSYLTADSLIRIKRPQTNFFLHTKKPEVYWTKESQKK